MCQPLRDVCTLLTWVPSRLFLAGEAPTDTVWFERRLSRSPSETLSVKIRLGLCESLRQMYFVLRRVCSQLFTTNVHSVSHNKLLQQHTHNRVLINQHAHSLGTFTFSAARGGALGLDLFRWDSSSVETFCETFLGWASMRRFCHTDTHITYRFFNSCGSDTPRTPLGHTIRLVNLCFVQFLL